MKTIKLENGKEVKISEEEYRKLEKIVKEMDSKDIFLDSCKEDLEIYLKD